MAETLAVGNGDARKSEQPRQIEECKIFLHAKFLKQARSARHRRLRCEQDAGAVDRAERAWLLADNDQFLRFVALGEEAQKMAYCGG